MLRQFIVLLALCSLSGCFPYVYRTPDRARIHGIDVDATLDIARTELEEGGFDATLAIWAMRDQPVTAANAQRISMMYFTYIDRVAAERKRSTADFGVWHFTWAIANLYRNGDDQIRAELENAYVDALKRPQTQQHFKGAAAAHVKGDRLYTGDIHAFARSYGRSHIVAPGNKKFLQSVEEYTKRKTKQSAQQSSLEPEEITR